MDDDNDAKSWPRYRCHKVVRALKIERIEELRQTRHDPEGGHRLHFVEGVPSIDVDRLLFARYHPVPGDYLVQYEGDGYRSISPARAFEEGYTRTS